jgi:hypothetical protein
VKILVEDALEAPKLIPVSGDAVEGLRFSTHYSAEAAEREASKIFAEAYQKKYNKIPNALIVAQNVPGTSKVPGT